MTVVERIAVPSLTAEMGVQKQVEAFLARPRNHGTGVSGVQFIETHISKVFLAGDRALKMKRAVKLSYVDFSTLARRHAACRAEVEINRRTAPDLYLGVVPVTQDNIGNLALGGSGKTVEWLVEMQRFDQNQLFHNLAVEQKLKRPMMEELADSIAAFHSEAKPARDVGGRDAMMNIFAANDKCLRQFAGVLFATDEIDRLDHLCRTAANRVADRLEGRREAGMVRHCHGDLHLRNIVLWRDEPTMFDAIEFDPRLAEIDVFYDLAFLLMDIDAHDLRRLGNVLLNRYLAVTGDVGGLGCLQIYLASRAAIRAHVLAANASTAAEPVRSTMVEEARQYLALAIGYFVDTKPRLIAVGGLSGSGKSRLARVLAPKFGRAPGAYLARSDAIRKRLAGVDLNDKLPAANYTAEMSRLTYKKLYEEAQIALSCGQSVIADAVFARPEERQAIAAVAAKANVPFDGIWLTATTGVMAERIENRHRNISDATTAVLDQQLTYDLGKIDWRTIDSGGPRKATLKAAATALGLDD